MDNHVHHTSESTGPGNVLGWVIVLIIFLVLLYVFFVFLLPLMRGASTGTSVIVPRNIDINVDRGPQPPQTP